MYVRWAVLCGLLVLFANASAQEKAASDSSSSSAPPISGPAPSTPNVSAATSAPSQPLAELPDSKLLEPIKTVKAVYPLGAEKDRLQGQVVVKFTVSETGDVEKVEAVSGNPVLATAALDAAKKWKFKPFIRNGKAVKAATNIRFDFAYPQNVNDIKPKEEKPVLGQEQTAPAGASSPSAPGSTSTASSTSADSSSTQKVGVQRVRVAQGILQGMVLHKVAPVYPPKAKREELQGTVVLAAIIGKDGAIKNLKYFLVRET